MKKPIYKRRPITTLESLSRCLSVPVVKLRNIAIKAEEFYFPSAKSVVKADGTQRTTYGVKKDLKEVQKSILKHIFYHVAYPEYLQGAIRDRVMSRDYVTNASNHINQRVILREDVKRFFPSIAASQVCKMWRFFFHFSCEIAELLTKLTTYKGFVPEGASTSTYIANLIFWDKEPELENTLREQGFRYTRFVDDITVSTDKKVTPHQLGEISEAIYFMLGSKGVKPNRKKRKVQFRGSRMEVHKLVVNSSTPTLAKEKWSEIRSSVRKVENAAKIPSRTKEFESLHKSVLGKVTAAFRLQPRKAKQYMERLEKCSPANLFRKREL